MKVNKFSFLILTLVFCACSVFVSAKENETKATNQLSIKKVPCQQKAHQLFQPTPFAQFRYDLSANSGTRINNGLLPLGFAMPPPIFTFLLEEELDFTEDGPHRPISGKPPISWTCVAVCVAWCGQNYACLTNCMNGCIMN